MSAARSVRCSPRRATSPPMPHLLPRAAALCGTLTLSASVAAAQLPTGGATYCNPIDIDYKYNWEQEARGVSYRTSADPVIVTHRGAYYLFATVAGGYWRSTDLRDWRYVTPSRWPFEDVVAPAAIPVGDTLLLMQSAFAPRPILYSTAPATGRLEFYNRMLPELPWAVIHGSDRGAVE